MAGVAPVLHGTRLAAALHGRLPGPAGHHGRCHGGRQCQSGKLQPLHVDGSEAVPLPACRAARAGPANALPAEDQAAPERCRRTAEDPVGRPHPPLPSSVRARHPRLAQLCLHGRRRGDPVPVHPLLKPHKVHVHSLPLPHCRGLQHPEWPAHCHVPERACRPGFHRVLHQLPCTGQLWHQQHHHGDGRGQHPERGQESGVQGDAS
mmetsp:Transcript_23103/g.52943  ORF Transcript_23103/g.52943 Transcript_23103/m.52943 type:complete len:206 (-) Transcript_23103:643-1260(-)